MTVQGGAVLTAQEATIQTAQVEIRVMKVGKKQVTMGMFRQVPHKPFHDPLTLERQGVPWGWVHYWWDGDGSSFSHGHRLHLVWQSGETLYRAVVYSEAYPGVRAQWSAARVPLSTQLVLLRLRTTTDHLGFCLHVTHDTQHVRLGPLDCTIHVSMEDCQAINAYLSLCHHIAIGYPNLEARHAEACARYDAILAEHGVSLTSLPSVEADIRNHDASIRDYERRLAEEWAELSALPQLFIAV
jgi:hypothetical protein